jgi:lipopolysaccharide export LptBFGC system permease protein LptF
MAYMMGVLFAFGSLTQSNEITAMKAAGVPLKRVVVPVLIGGAALGAATFVLQDRIQPLALARFNRLVYFDMAARGTLEVLPTGVMHQFGDWRVYIGSKDPVKKVLYDVNLLVPRGDDSLVFYAKTGALEGEGAGERLVLRDGYLTQTLENGDLSIHQLKYWSMDLPELAETVAPGRLKLLTIEQLIAFQAREGLPADYGGVSFDDPRQIRESRMEIGDRLTFPLACVAVSLVAAPLAVRARRGGRSYSFAIGFTVGIVFFLLYIVLKPQSVASLAETILRSLAPVLILGLAGTVFLWRVDRV